MNRTRNFLIGLLLLTSSTYFCFGGLLVIGEYNGLSNFVIGIGSPPLFWVYSYALGALFSAFSFQFIDSALEGDGTLKRFESFHVIIGVFWSILAAVFNGSLCMFTNFCVFTF